jgi:hypothetical protein
VGQGGAGGQRAAATGIGGGEEEKSVRAHERVQAAGTEAERASGLRGRGGASGRRSTATAVSSCCRQRRPLALPPCVRLPPSTESTRRAVASGFPRAPRTDSAGSLLARGVLYSLGSGCHPRLASLPSHVAPTTTGNEDFAECPEICREQNIRHSAKILFAECSTRQRKTHGKFILCRVSGTRHNKTLGKEFFAECRALGKG